MKIITPSHTYLNHEGLSSYQFIEKIGRTCYKSTDKITNGSAERFVEMLVKNKHLAMIEHEVVHIGVSEKQLAKSFSKELVSADNNYMVDNKYIRVSIMKEISIITGNLRAFYDLFSAILCSKDPETQYPMTCAIWGILKGVYGTIYNTIDAKNFEETPYITIAKHYMSIFTTQEVLKLASLGHKKLYRHIPYTVLFVCDRGVSHELVRHRPCSFAQESTRYCNYTKGKFGNELTVIEPYYYKDEPKRYAIWKAACEGSERAYIDLINLGSTPQEARSVLPNSLKTEIIMTAYEDEWQHIVNLRAKGTTGKPHPQMVEVMTPWYKELIEITGGRIV